MHGFHIASVVVFVLVCNFGQDWEVGDIQNVRTPYKAMMKGEINASIGLHIGLRSINITLLGMMHGIICMYRTNTTF